MVSFSSSIRHARHFASATSSVTSSTTSTGISISTAKSRLRSEHDPDKALKIYSSVSDHYKNPISSRYAQDCTIKRLAKCHRFDDIETLLEAHKKNPKITQEPYLCTLIRSYGQAGMFDHAVRTFNQMEDLGTPRSALSFNALLSACNMSKKFDQVPKLFTEISEKHRISPDKISYGILVKSYCESGSPESAYPILKEMEEKGVEITAVTYTTLLDALYKMGKKEEAEKIWNEMNEKGCSPDVTTYNVRIMEAHHSKPEDVMALMEEMSAAGLKPNTISYNYLMTSYCKIDKMEDAKKVYEDLEVHGCSANAATFRTLIYHLCRNGAFVQAYALFKESVKRGMIPDFGTAKHLVEGLVKDSRMKEVKELLRTVKKKFPPNLLNAWKRLEENLGLNADTKSSSQEESPAT